ncbi:MAG: sigma factor-like helix-turn-helix DNA-binding protein, partial [Bacteroidales bacterium]|nr:sigma factor-like helix-turn-helix DNA-binding protein [Bacteroidales bacterium]
DSSIMRESLGKELQRSLSILNDREREIIHQFFGIGQEFGYTLDEIAVKHSLPRERVRQIRDRAIKRLKNRAITQDLMSYLG